MDGDLAYAAEGRYGDADAVHAGNGDNAYDGAAGEPVDPGEPEVPVEPGEPPPPPAASFSYDPPGPKRGDYVTFDGSASVPGNDAVPITRYDWKFADKADKPDAGPVVEWRVPGAYGTYPVTLTVTASDSQQDAAVHDIVLAVDETKTEPPPDPEPEPEPEPETRSYGGRA